MLVLYNIYQHTQIKNTVHQPNNKKPKKMSTFNAAASANNTSNLSGRSKTASTYKIIILL